MTRGILRLKGPIIGSRRVEAIVGPAEAPHDALEHKNSPCEAVVQLAWSACAEQTAEDQTQIERADVN